MQSHTFNESRKRFEPHNKKCSFCRTGGRNTNMEDNCFYSVYNIQDRTNLLVYRNVKFNEIKIGVPRCTSCRSVHSNAKMASHISVFVGVLLIFIIPIYFTVKFSLGTIGLILLMASTFGLVYLGMKALEKGILDANEVKSEKEGALREPLVREFLRNGWSDTRPTA